MTRILLGTPLKGNPTLPYMLGIADALRLVDAEYVLSVANSTYVQCGRQHLVQEARKLGCDELIFVDSDIGFTKEHVQRLRGHENVDIVGALYAKRQDGEAKWTAHATGDPQVGALIPVNDLGMGLCRIKMSVFERLDAVFPHKRYKHNGEAAQTEYFPVHRTLGSGSQTPAEARLEAIAAILSQELAGVGPWAITSRISALIAAEWPVEGVSVCGEDVSFVRMCRTAGITAYIDSECRVRHYGQIGFPAQQLPL